MLITQYISKQSVKCKIFNNLITHMDIPCEIKTIYTEDVGERYCMKNNIRFVPTLIIEGSKDKIVLSGQISPTQIQEAITKVDN